MTHPSPKFEYALFEEKDDVTIDTYINARQRKYQKRKKRSTCIVLTVTVALAATIVVCAHHYYTESVEESLDLAQTVADKAKFEMGNYVDFKKRESAIINAMKKGLTQIMESPEIPDEEKETTFRNTKKKIQEIEDKIQNANPRKENGAVRFMLTTKKENAQDSVMGVVIDRIKEVAAKAFAGTKQTKFMDWARSAWTFAAGPSIDEESNDETLVKTFNAMDKKVKRIIDRIKTHQVPKLQDLKEDAQ